MNIWQIIIIVAGIVVLALLALLVFRTAKSRKETPLSPLLILAMGLTVSGITFSSDRILGYSLLGTGIVISVIEIVRLARKRAL